MNNPKPKLLRIVTVPESFSLFKGQMRLMSKTFEVIGVSSPGTSIIQVEKEELIKIHKLKLTRQITPIQDFISLIKLVLLIYKEKPLIVHSHTPKAGTIGMIAAYICRVPNRIHTVAGLPLMETEGAKRRMLNLVERLTYFFSTTVLTNSFGLKDFILQERFTKNEKITVIGNGSTNGVDCNYYNPKVISTAKTLKLKQKYHIHAKDFVFIFIGRVVKDKGVIELVDAFVKFQKIVSYSKLFILGNFESELDPLPTQTILEIKTNPMILNVGWQNDVRPFFMLSDLLLFPSYREGFPNVVLQSGAMGVPAIVTDINGCNEIIENDLNGWIIPVKDSNSLLTKMIFAYENESNVLRMGKSSIDLVTRRYSKEYLWNEIEQFYYSILN
jgi:glycosyltransferase involved in cell wall biosynthesis